MSEIDKGSRVVVTKGKKSVGATGTVFWIGDNKFGEGKRLGIEGDDGETHWIPMEYVEATEMQAPDVEAPEKGSSVSWGEGEEQRTGTVFWVGESKSGKGWRVGVKDAEEETHWLDARQLQIAPSTDPEEEPPF